MKTPFWLCFLGLLLLPLASRADEKVKVGSAGIQIPLPQGFERYDGIDAKTDKIMQSMLPPSNRSLLVLAPPDKVARLKAGEVSNLDRFMNIQTLRQAEGQEVTLKDFQQILPSLEKQFSPQGGGLGDVEKETNKRIEEAKLGVELKLGQPVLLGTSNKTDRSLDMAMLLKTTVGTEKPTTMVAAASFMLVRGKVLFVYVYANFDEPDDVKWARDTVAQWRKAIRAANEK